MRHARLLLSRLLTDQHELVTLIEGEGSEAGDTRRITEWLSEEYPDIALEVHHGGQPLYPVPPGHRVGRARGRVASPRDTPST